MAVELAAPDEGRHRVLLDPGGRLVGDRLLVADGVQQRGRDGHPAEPQGGREGLGGRARVDDAVRVEALQRPDGGPVVAVLRVVVVLDRDRAVLAQPVHERAAPLGREHDARRVLVRRGEHDRAGAGALERLDHEARAVDRHGHGLEARAPRDRPLLGRARVLDRDPPHPARRQRPADQAEALDVAAGDDDPRRLGHHPAHAPEVVGERRRAATRRPHGSP